MCRNVGRQHTSELGGGDRRDFAGVLEQGSKASKRAGAKSLLRAMRFSAGTRGVIVLWTLLVHVGRGILSNHETGKEGTAAIFFSGPKFAWKPRISDRPPFQRRGQISD